jgi:hypothetical protein
MINPYELKNKWSGKDIDFSGTLITRSSLERLLNLFKKRLNLNSPPTLGVGLTDDREHTVSLEELVDSLKKEKFPSAAASLEILKGFGGKDFYLWARLRLEFDQRGRSRFCCHSRDNDESQKDWPVGFSREMEEIRDTLYPPREISADFKKKFGNTCVLDLEGSVLRELHEAKSAQQRDSKEFKSAVIKQLVDIFTKVGFVVIVLLTCALIRVIFNFDVLSWVERILTASFGGVL